MEGERTQSNTSLDVFTGMRFSQRSVIIAETWCRKFTKSLICISRLTAFLDRKQLLSAWDLICGCFKGHIHGFKEQSLFKERLEYTFVSIWTFI